MLLPTKGQGTPLRYHYRLVSLITCNQWLIPNPPLLSHSDKQISHEQIANGEL